MKVGAGLDFHPVLQHHELLFKGVIRIQAALRIDNMESTRLKGDFFPIRRCDLSLPLFETLQLMKISLFHINDLRCAM